MSTPRRHGLRARPHLRQITRYRPTRHQGARNTATHGFRGPPQRREAATRRETNAPRGDDDEHLRRTAPPRGRRNCAGIHLNDGQNMVRQCLTSGTSPNRRRAQSWFTPRAAALRPSGTVWPFSVGRRLAVRAARAAPSGAPVGGWSPRARRGAGAAVGPRVSLSGAWPPVARRAVPGGFSAACWRVGNLCHLACIMGASEGCGPSVAV